jgi:hypothetical protein
VDSLVLTKLWTEPPGLHHRFSIRRGGQSNIRTEARAPIEEAKRSAVAGTLAEPWVELVARNRTSLLKGCLSKRVRTGVQPIEKCWASRKVAERLATRSLD